MAYKLLKLYIKLRELGHQKYIKVAEESTAGPPLLCSINPEEAEDIVKKTKHELTVWTNEVAKLHSEFSWLLFFRAPKVLRLYHLLTGMKKDGSSSVHLRQIIREISFLCINSDEARQQLSSQVQVCVCVCVYVYVCVCVCVCVCVASYPGLPMFFNVCIRKIGKGWSIL